MKADEIEIIQNHAKMKNNVAIARKKCIFFGPSR
jgi:hypothetical protein